MSSKIWYFLDWALRCKVQWICDRNEEAITGYPP